MGLSDIAAGIEVTAEQRERGIPTADDTATPLSDRLAPFADGLPCEATAAAVVVEAYAEGASVARVAAVADLPETTAAKTLYLLGEPIDPLTPTAEGIVEAYLAGELARNEAQTLANVGETEFALGVYLATHEPIDGAETAVADALSVERPADPLADARGGVDDWL